MCMLCWHLAMVINVDILTRKCSQYSGLSSSIHPLLSLVVIWFEVFGSGIVATVFGATGFLGRYVVQQLGKRSLFCFKKMNTKTQRQGSQTKGTTKNGFESLWKLLILTNVHFYFQSYRRKGISSIVMIPWILHSNLPSTMFETLIIHTTPIEKSATCCLSSYFSFLVQLKWDLKYWFLFELLRTLIDISNWWVI